MGIGTFYIAVIAFNGLVGIVTQPHTMSNCAAGKNNPMVPDRYCRSCLFRDTRKHRSGFCFWESSG
jgi:hypothetical protein